ASALDPDLALAARNLGASRGRTLLAVLLPLLAPALAVGTAFAGLMAFNEVVLPVFWTSWKVKPLSRILWDSMRFEVDPAGMAIGTLLLAATLVAALLASRCADRELRRRG